MIEKYKLLKSFPGYKKGLIFTYDNEINKILTDLVNKDMLHCELPDDVIYKNKSWFLKIND